MTPQFLREVASPHCPQVTSAFKRSLRKDIFYNPTRDVRETEIPSLRAVCQSFMIDTQDVQHGCVRVVDFDRWRNSVIAKVVSLPITEARFYTTAGQPPCEVVPVVVASHVRIYRTLRK